MKKLIIMIVVLFLIVGGIAATVCFNTLSKDKEASNTIQTAAPSGSEETAPTVTPEVEEPEASNTPLPTEEVATEAPTKEPEATATAEAETAAPEVDYSKLSDSELAEKMVTVIKDRHADVKQMTDKERTVYSVYMYSKDAKSSLYNYLTGSNNATAAYVSDALAAVNATMTKELFNDFIDSSRIKVSSVSTLNKLVKEDYHFDVFDEEYAEIAKSENLTSLLASYIKNNLDDLK